jgi:hypothetical protein
VLFAWAWVFIWLLIMQCLKKGWPHLFVLEDALCCLKPIQPREILHIIVYMIDYDREPME